MAWNTNTSDAYYTATNFNPDTTYELSTHTVDTHGNVNVGEPDTSVPATNDAFSGTITYATSTEPESWA